MEGVLRVRGVDDSAYVRKVVKEMLSRSPFIEVVGAARDGIRCVRRRRRPVHWLCRCCRVPARTRNGQIRRSLPDETGHRRQQCYDEAVA